MNSKQALQTFGRSGNPMFSEKTFSETIIDVNIERMRSEEHTSELQSHS